MILLAEKNIKSNFYTPLKTSLIGYIQIHYIRKNIKETLNLGPTKNIRYTKSSLCSLRK